MDYEELAVRRPWIVRKAKAFAAPVVWGWLFRHLIVKDIPDADVYTPNFEPWRRSDFLDSYRAIAGNTCCPPASVYTLLSLAKRSLRKEGDVFEAGVWKGGTAKLLLDLLRDDANHPTRKLYLFDSFEGMKATADVDRHRVGDFADTSLEAVKQFIGPSDAVVLRKGWIPETFAGLEDRRFCFAHVDVDLYQSVVDCLMYLYPRMVAGGVIVFDDYGYASCPGARQAVDEFFAARTEDVLALHTGQGIVLVE